MDFDSDDDDRWEPSLYHAPVAFTRVRIGNAMDMLRLYPYLCACIEDPSVAASLQVLVLRNETWKEYTSRDERNLSSSEKSALQSRNAAHTALLSHIDELCLSETSTNYIASALQDRRHSLLDDIASSTSHTRFATAAAIVLLSLCPNIKTLHIDTAAHDNPLGEFLLKNNHSLLPSRYLQHLTSVICCPDTTYHALHQPHEYADVGVPDIARSFHRLPSLRSLSFVGVMLENASCVTFLAPRSGTFTRLSLEHIDLNTAEVCSLIRAAAKLEGLSISLGGMCQLLGSCVSIVPKTLGKSILQHRRTLRVLDLGIKEARASKPEEEQDMSDYFREESRYEFDEWFHLEEAASSGPGLKDPIPDTRWYGGGIGSLRDFDVLTRLSVQPAKLIGGNEEMWAAEAGSVFPGRPRLVDMLPPSLEYLCFYGYKHGRSEWLDDQVEELLMQKAEKLPKLREVVGCGDDDEDSEEDEDSGSDCDMDYYGEDEEDRYWSRPSQALGWVQAEAAAQVPITLAMR